MTDVREPQVQQNGASTNGGEKPGTTVIVDVFYAKDANGTLGFSHDWRFQGGNSKGGGKIVIPKKQKGERGNPIHFNLHDDTKTLSFVEDVDDVIWVDRTACPEEQKKDPEITGIDPSQNLLKVYDENNDDCELHYALRFEPDPEKYCYDPEIKNGGRV